MAVPPTMPIEGLKPIRAAEAAVKAMRDAVGETIDIMVDCHARPSPAMGMKFAKALEPFGCTFWRSRAGRSLSRLGGDQCGSLDPDCDRRARDELADFRDLFAAVRARFASST